MISSRLVPYVAYLRIYEPISKFPIQHQKVWKGLESSLNVGFYDDKNSLQRMISTALPVSNQNDVYTIVEKGKRYCCPKSSLTRSLAAINELRDSLPKQIFKYFVDKSYEEIEAFINQIEDKVVHIKSEAWNIPPRWFGLFRPEERNFGYIKNIPFTIFRTELGNALDRIQNMHKIVLSSFGSGQIEQDIGSLIEWLKNFDSKSIIELDYGGLALLMDNVLKNNGERGIQDDTSVDDLFMSLDGLVSEDGRKAGIGYERLVTKWRKVAAFEHAF